MPSINHDHYMQIAETIASASYCERLKVGAIIVTEDGIIIPGYNGTPSGLENCCEEDGVTKQEVIHAEMNALLKVANSTLSAKNATMYVTHTPCINCAKMIREMKIKVVYCKNHYRTNDGATLLAKGGIPVLKI